MSRTSSALRRLSVPVLVASMLATGLGGVANAASGVPNGTLTLTATPPSQTIGDGGSTINATYNQGSASGAAGALVQALTFTASGSAKFANGTNTTTCTTAAAGDNGICSSTALKDTVSEAVTVTVTDSTDVTVPAATITVNVAGLHFTNCAQTGANTAGNCVTQAAAGQVQTASTTYLQNGVGKDGVTVTFTIANVVAVPAGTEGQFTATQPAGTSFFSSSQVVCTTSGGGKCSVTYIDNNNASHADTLTATTSNEGGTYPHSTAVQTVNIVPSTTPGRIIETGSTLIEPAVGGTAGVAQPGDAVQKQYTLYSTCTTAPADYTCQGTALAGVSVNLSVDHGFFTPNCTSADVSATTNYANCSFSPAPAVGGAVGNLVNSGATKTVTTGANGVFTVTLGIARDSAFDDAGLVSAVVSGVAAGSSSTLPTTNTGNGTANQTCTTTTAGCPNATAWSTKTTPLNGGTVSFKAVDGNSIAGTPNHVPTTQARVYVVQATDQFGNLTNDAADPNAITLAAKGQPELWKCGSYTTTNPCSGLNTVGGAIASDSNGVQTRTYATVTPSYNALFDSAGVTTQQRYEAASSIAGTQTDTATWKAPVTTFNTFAPATASAPAVVTYAQTTATKTATVVFDFYVQNAQPVVTFATTPSNSVSTGTTATVSATVKDQFGAPIQGANVQFIRSGNNDSSCTPTYPYGYTQSTNAQGMAGFSFTCNTAGTSNVSIIVSDGSGNELARGTQSVTFGPGTPGTGSVPSLATSANYIVVGQSVNATVTGTPGELVQLLGANNQNKTFVVFRQANIGSNGTVTFFNIAPKVNSYVQARTVEGASNTRAIGVRPIIHMTATLVGTNTGVFTGTVAPGPAGRIVTIYYVTPNGVFPAINTTVDSNGNYRATRTFVHKTRLLFVALTRPDNYNISNRSEIRTFTTR
jgi:hypothetical protein